MSSPTSPHDFEESYTKMSIPQLGGGWTTQLKQTQILNMGTFPQVSGSTSKK